MGYSEDPFSNFGSWMLIGVYTHTPSPRMADQGPHRWVSCIPAGSSHSTSHQVGAHCRVGRKSQRNSSAASIVMLAPKRVSWRGRYELYRKPDFCRRLISSPPHQVCWGLFIFLPFPPHPDTAFCSAGGVVTNLEKFYPGNTVMEMNTLEPLFLITSSVWAQKRCQMGANFSCVASSMSLYIFLFVRYLHLEERLLAAAVTSKWFSSLLVLSREREEGKPEVSGWQSSVEVLVAAAWITAGCLFFPFLPRIHRMASQLIHDHIL